ncbi:phage protein YopX [Enterococcus sp. AZ078]|uniref:YopX family protein n=1 Tax=Enterococcus sp. AZ078 TaxID=2774710 RepID=UPI003F208CBD
MIPKFRAWDQRKNVMRDVAVLHFTKSGKVNTIEYWKTPSELKSYHVRNIELMQSTGLKDKNGVEIFEGDLVSISVQNGFDYLDKKVCIVKNSIDYSGLVCASVEEDLEYQVFNTELFEEYTYEVIGNIYENSELLEEQQ